MISTSGRAELAELADRAWMVSLAAAPLLGTSLGDPRYDDRLGDNTPAGRAYVEQARREIAARAAAVPLDGLDLQDRTTRAALLGFVETELALQIPAADWSVDPMEGPAVALAGAGAIQPVDTGEQREATLRRWNAMGPFIDQHAANLRAALADGRVAAAVLVRKVIGQLDDLLAAAPDHTPLLDAARSETPGVTDAERTAFAAELEAVVSGRIRPAFERLRTLLLDEILPAARPDDRAGLGHLPGGDELYRQAIRGFATLDLSPAEVQEIGLRAVRHSDRELTELGGRVLGTTGLADTLLRLRTGAGLTFSSAEEILAVATAAVARAEAAVPDWFGLRHHQPCEIRAVPSHHQEHGPFAYYQWPAADGSRPGVYYVNTFMPRTRSRADAVTNACHEAVPGHHLQISVAQALSGLPDFRRLAPVPAYAEGWGLYAERLGEEMGVYPGDLDRLGYWSKDALRSCRLVVDTGLHAFGWTRQQALDYLLAHCPLPPPAAESEVDRYLAWPGQALSYKLGHLELSRLREESRSRLGAEFDIRRFHDAVLGAGSLPLAALREVVSTAVS